MLTVTPAPPLHWGQIDMTVSTGNAPSPQFLVQTAESDSSVQIQSFLTSDLFTLSLSLLLYACVSYKFTEWNFLRNKEKAYQNR